MSVRSRDSFQQVILDDRIANVGDYRITANDDGKGFMYMLSFTIAQGISASDKMSVELKTPEIRGIGAVGLYIHEAKQGVLYYPTQYSRPMIIMANDKDDFRLKVLKNYGIQITGGGIG